MKPVFADTSYFLALANANDQSHVRADDLSQSLLGRMYVSEYVLMELGNSLSRSADRIVYLQTLIQIEQEPNMIVVPASDRWFQIARELFANRLDKDWSMVDCASFAIMAHYKIRDALTADRHFEQAGFKALLR